MIKATILVVDDQPTLLTTMSKLLEPYYHVRVANSGERALIVSSTKPKPDLILLDVQMVGMDGYQVLKTLKENKKLKDIPVIFVTSKESFVDEERGLSLGAVDYITKPVNPAILLARVKNHIRLKQASNFIRDNNLFLQKEISRRLAENQLIQDVSIRALAHLAETRDIETGDHILRTQLYVEALARELQGHSRFSDIIDNSFINTLSKSAPLHDIGKVGIPDNILLKPGKLNAKEWLVMKTHTVLGANAIEKAERDLNYKVEFLIEAKNIARWHHERWDGKGYPDQLIADEIPLSARLMTIADVFDALISRRVYKEPLAYELARDIIISDRGKRFDPDITDAFAHIYPEFVAIADQYSKEG